MKIFTRIVIALIVLSFINCSVVRDVLNETANETLSCIPPTSGEYNVSYNIVKGKTFKNDMEESAKRETKKLECLTTNQIKRIAELMTFEKSRLDYAKYAYRYCSDSKNYYQMNDIFTFESSKRELEEFIQ